MTFPERARKGSTAHVDAVRRLDQARDRQHETQEALDASAGTPSERTAEQDLANAREQTAAREAWLVWLERGF